MNKNVIVLGASDKADRYSNKAVKFLVEKGYNVIPVHPRVKVIDNIEVLKSIDSITSDIDTVTLYVNPSLLENYVDSLLTKNIRRVIFNPGTESESVKEKLEAKGIETIEACTLVMLRTGQF